MSRTKDIKVSVVIIAYNEAHIIRHCLDALAGQTIRPYEVIVVNNNSTDATAEIAASYPFVTVIDEKEQGMIPARNCGLDYASGDVLARIDADTVPCSEWLECIKARFADDSVDALTGPGGVYELSSVTDNTLEVFSRHFFSFNRRVFGFQVVWGSNMVLRRQVWQTIRHEACHYDWQVHEDLDLSVLMHRHGFNKHYAPELKVQIHGVRFVKPKKLVDYYRRSLLTRNYHRQRGTLQLPVRSMH